MGSSVSAQVRVLFDATHKEWGEIWNKELKEFLGANGYQIDTEYITNVKILNQKQYSLNPGSSVSFTFDLNQNVPVLVLTTANAGSWVVPEIKVTDPNGKVYDTILWLTPHNLHFHKPSQGTWKVTLSLDTTWKDPAVNTLVVGYVSQNPISNDLLRNYQILMLDLPISDLDTEEISTILDLINSGGGLFIGGGWTNLNTLTRSFGIQFTQEKVEDKLHNDQGGAIITNFVASPVTNGLTRVVGGAMLIIQTPAVAVAYSDSDSTPANAPLIAISQFGLGKIAVVGDEYTFANYFDSADNKKLASNLMAWLSHPLTTTASSQGSSATTSSAAISTTAETFPGSTQIAAAIILAALIVAAAIILRGKHPQSAGQKEETRVY